MDFTPPGFDEDEAFGHDGELLPLTDEQRAALAEYQRELTAFAARHPQPEEVAGMTW